MTPRPRRASKTHMGGDAVGTLNRFLNLSRAEMRQRPYDRAVVPVLPPVLYSVAMSACDRPSVTGGKRAFRGGGRWPKSNRDGNRPGWRADAGAESVRLPKQAGDQPSGPPLLSHNRHSERYLEKNKRSELPVHVTRPLLMNTTQPSLTAGYP